MAKELPYFRFTASEWQNGKISLESYELQGFFINVCCYYWNNDCNLSLSTLEKKFKSDKKLIKLLLESEIIKNNEENNLIEIFFLNEQFDILSTKRKLRQDAGRLGGLSKASEMTKDENPSNAKANDEAMLKQCSSYKDKDNNKDKDKDKDNLKKSVSKNLSKTELDNQLLESYTQSEINVAYLCLDWIADNTPTLNKMKSPLKVQEALKLIEQFGKELLKTKLYAMENWTKILTKKSTYLTALDWLKQEGTTAKPQLTLQQKREAEEVAGCRYFRKIEEKDMLPENPFKYTKVSDMITTKLPEINSIEQLNETLKNIIK